MTKHETEGRKIHRYRGQSRDERQAERRQRLLRAGIALIGRDGYHGTSVRAVCSEAGLTERYFYESFTNSEALLTACYEALIEQLRLRLLEALASAPAAPELRAKALLQTFFESMHEDRAAARIILHEVLGVSPAVDSLYRRAIRDFEQLLRQLGGALLHPQSASGADFVAAGLIGSVLMIAWRWSQMDYRAPVEQLVEDAALIFDASLSALARRAEASAGASAMRVATR